MAELAAVLEEVGVHVAPAARVDTHADLELPGGVKIEVKAASRPTIGRLQRLGLDRREPNTMTVLVADQLDPGVRKALKDAGWGWLDRTGHLRLIAGPVQIDRPIPSLIGPEPAPADPLGRPTGMAVGLELLTIHERRSTRALAQAASVSVASAHATLTELADAGLVVDGRARHPDLFWAIADRWHLRWFRLGEGPIADIPPGTQTLLRMRLDELESSGWAQVGDGPGQAFGAPVASEGLPRFYLPDQRALTWALRTWGEVTHDRSASCLIAVPPTRHATESRIDVGDAWPSAPPLVVALDLAADGSPRSRDILDNWTDLPDGTRRVW